MTVTQTLPNVASLPSRWWRSSEKIWLPAWKKRDGDPVVNAAGLLPVMPIYEPVAIAIYHIVKLKAYSDSEFSAEINALNSDSWGGFTAHQCWISEIHTGGIEEMGASLGEEVHYVVRCTDREDGWKTVVPNCGYSYKDGADITSFQTVDGQPYIGNLHATTGAEETDFNSLALETKKTIAFNSINGF